VVDEVDATLEFIGNLASDDIKATQIQ